MRHFVIFFFLSVLISCNNKSKKHEVTGKSYTKAQEFDSQAPPIDSAAMMQAMYTYMTPGSIHEMIAGYTGKWKANMIYREAPEAIAKTSDAIVELNMILGGRYQEGRYSGTFAGMPFEAVSLMGYDKITKMFVNSYADNLGTCILYMQGAWDEATRTVQFKGKVTHPVLGANINIRENLRFIDDKNQHLETFMDYGGKEFKNMEIKLTKM